MKKIFFTTLLLSIVSTLNAQEAEDKKVQAGLVFGAGMSFQKSQTKYMESNGIGNDLTLGANVVFNFNKNIGFCTGLEFDFSTMKYKGAKDSSIFYTYNDTKILQKEDLDGGSTGSIFRLEERKQKAYYLSVPTMLIFRTNFIGYFRYFGKFGLRNSFMVANKNMDEGYVGLLSTERVENKNMKQKEDLFFYKGAAGIGGGAEWNFSGSTTLVAEICYYYNFVPLSITKKEKNMSLFSDGGSSVQPTFFANKMNQSQLMLKVSILF